MVVWGGVRSGNVDEVSDEAAYNPATRTWRTIASPPSGVLGGGGDGATWTGDAAVFWAGNSSHGPAAGAVYDPRTDSWERLPLGPLGPREAYASVWTGKELLIISGTEGDGFATPIAAAVDSRSRNVAEVRPVEADLRVRKRVPEDLFPAIHKRFRRVSTGGDAQHLRPDADRRDER